MRRAPVLMFLLAPVVMIACAFGKNGLPPGGGAGGSGASGATDGAGAGNVDPGSGDPGGTGEDGDAGGVPGAGGGGQGGGGQGVGSGPGGVGGGAQSCAHDPCTAGVALDPNCDPCVFETCNADSFCCESEWDDQCVGEATSCGCQGGAGGSGAGAGGFGGSGGGFGGSGGGFGGSGGGGPVGGDCAHDLCLPGEALDPGCDECAAAVCDVDPFCCDMEWDIYCILTIADVCSGSCF